MTYPNDLKRAARYMRAVLNAETRPLLENAKAILATCAAPKHIAMHVKLAKSDNGILAGELLLTGESIRKHLEGLSSGYLFAATLGTAVDEAIRREMVLSMAKGMALGACASVMLEEYADDVCRALPTKQHLTPRFSPGYGDLPLTIQPQFLQCIGAKRIGLYMTQGLMMTPEKSITAIIGETSDPTQSCQSNCVACGNIACPFREENV